MDLVYKDVNWIQMAQDRILPLALVNKLMSFCITQTTRIS